MKITRLRSRFLVLLLILGFLSGCGADEQSKGQGSDLSNETPASVGTAGQLMSIESDNVSAAGYNDDSMVMTVRFDNGALYEYYNVSPEVWTAFVEAQPHPWSQVGYPRLVQGGIPYKRIG